MRASDETVGAHRYPDQNAIEWMSLYDASGCRAVEFAKISCGVLVVGATTPVARRHHYVPRFYLDRFADQGRLRAFDRTRGETITTSPKAVAAENNFYRLPEVGPLYATQLEDALAAQDSESAAAIRNVVAEGRVSQSHRETLAAHIAFQLLRTRHHRNSARAVTAWMATAEAQVNLDRRLSDGDFELESERARAERLLRQLANGELAVTLHEDELLRWSFRSLEMFFEELRSGWNWVIVVLTTPRFITSDHPVCFLGEPELGSPASNVGLMNALETWFPLDPRRALVLTRDHSIGSPLIDLTDSHVRSINLRLALESERWSFFRPGTEGVGGFQIPPEPPQFEEVTIGHRDHADGTVGELVRLGMQRPHVPNERLLSGRRLRPFR